MQRTTTTSGPTRGRCEQPGRVMLITRRATNSTSIRTGLRRHGSERRTSAIGDLKVGPPAGVDGHCRGVLDLHASRSNITGSENLVLGLLGGLRVDDDEPGHKARPSPTTPSTPPGLWSPTASHPRPAGADVCLNPNAPKRLGSYLQVKTGDLSNVAERGRSMTRCNHGVFTDAGGHGHRQPDPRVPRQVYSNADAAALPPGQRRRGTAVVSPSAGRNEVPEHRDGQGQPYQWRSPPRYDLATAFKAMMRNGRRNNGRI